MRKNIITLHLLIATFMAPAFILVAVSGGLYLIGIKGATNKIDVPIAGKVQLDLRSETLEEHVRELIDESGLEIDFDYLKIRGSTVMTRPTSRDYLELNMQDGEWKVQKVSPDLQSSLIELHKGHGPTLFKTYQKLVAIGLIFVMLSGLWMGLSSKTLKNKTLIALGLGFFTFVMLALS